MSSARIADCKVFDVVKHRFQHPADGREGDFFLIDCADWVLVLPMTSAGKLVLVNQYRFGVDKLSWEPPGGVVDPGEEHDIVAAGLREMREETGYRERVARYLGWVHPNPAIISNRAHFVLAEDCASVGEQQLDANEEIQVAEYTLDDAFAMAARGDIHHCVAHAALFALCRALGKGPGR